MSLHGFNLLQNNVKPQDTWDKLNSWVTNVGRIIVIVVELVVIISFVARVIIDTQTKNLLEEEGALSQSLAAFKQREVEFRDRQQRFESYKQIWDEGSTYSDVIADINAVSPQSVQKLSISVQGDLINFNGEALVSQLSELENELKTSDKYSDVQVYEIERVNDPNARSTGEQASFGIKILVKPEILTLREKFSEQESEADGTT